MCTNDTSANYSNELLLALLSSIKEIDDCNNKTIKMADVRFSGPATIVFWDDGTKTVVKCTEGDTPNMELGVAMATLKYILGDTYKNYKKAVHHFIKEEETRKEKELLKAKKQNDG